MQKSLICSAVKTVLQRYNGIFCFFFSVMYISVTLDPKAATSNFLNNHRCRKARLLWVVIMLPRLVRLLLYVASPDQKLGTIGAVLTWPINKCGNISSGLSKPKQVLRLCTLNTALKSLWILPAMARILPTWLKAFIRFVTAILYSATKIQTSKVSVISKIKWLRNNIFWSDFLHTEHHNRATSCSLQLRLF